LSLDSPVFATAAGGPVLLFAKGDRLNYSPEYTGGAFADYSFPFGGSGLRGEFSASANYSSKSTVHVLAGNAAYSLSGDNLSIARASLSINSPDHWRATLFASVAYNWTFYYLLALAAAPSTILRDRIPSTRKVRAPRRAVLPEAVRA